MKKPPPAQVVAIDNHLLWTKCKGQNHHNFKVQRSGAARVEARGSNNMPTTTTTTTTTKIKTSTARCNNQCNLRNMACKDCVDTMATKLGIYIKIDHESATAQKGFWCLYNSHQNKQSNIDTKAPHKKEGCTMPQVQCYGLSLCTTNPLLISNSLLHSS